MEAELPALLAPAAHPPAHSPRTAAVHAARPFCSALKVLASIQHACASYQADARLSHPQLATLPHRRCRRCDAHSVTPTRRCRRRPPLQSLHLAPCARRLPSGLQPTDGPPLRPLAPCPPRCLLAQVLPK